MNRVRDLYLYACSHATQAQYAGERYFLPITKKNGMKLLKDVGSLLYDYVGVAVYYNWYIFNKNYIYYELIKCHTTHNG